MKTMMRVFVVAVFALIVSWSFTPTVQAAESTGLITHVGGSDTDFWVRIDNIGWMMLGPGGKSKSMFATALTAFSAGKPVYVIWEGSTVYVLYVTN